MLFKNAASISFKKENLFFSINIFIKSFCVISEKIVIRNCLVINDIVANLQLKIAAFLEKHIAISENIAITTCDHGHAYDVTLQLLCCLGGRNY